MKIVFLDADSVGGDISLGAIEKLGNLTLYSNTLPEQVNDRIIGADVVITNKVVLNKESISSAPSIKLICVAATGVNNVDCEYAKLKNIPVRNVAGYSTESVAQVTFMHILNIVGHGIYFDHFVKSGDYSRSGHFSDVTYPFFELKGKRLGVIGMGNIGQRVAFLGTAFGMEVVYFSTSGTSHCTDYPSLSLEGLLSTSDVISVNAPLNSSTNNLIAYRELEQMKKNGVIINLGRGGIINEEDLIRALNDGLLAGAAIDVFQQEPIPQTHPYLSKLRDPKKLVLSPHVGWTSKEARLLLVEMIADNIRKGW